MLRDTNRHIKVLGSRVNILSIPEVLRQIDVWIRSYGHDGKCKQIVVTGFHGIWEAHKNPELKKILNSADLWVPDGIAPVWCARFRGFSGIQRTLGAEIMRAFFDEANNKKYSSFFYGDTVETHNALTEKVDKEYPGHKVVGTFSPPFRPLTQTEDEQVIRIINDARPDILWVALGMPKQDRWIFEHKEKLWNSTLQVNVGKERRRCNEYLVSKCDDPRLPCAYGPEPSGARSDGTLD